MLKKIEVEVVYALVNQQYVKKVVLNNGATVKQVIIASTVLELHSNINLNINKVGIYNQLVNLSHIVKNGDRVEIYRPLIADFKKLLKKRKERLLKKK